MTKFSKKKNRNHLTVSFGCKDSCGSAFRIKNTTRGYANRGGGPNSLEDSGNCSVTMCSVCDDCLLEKMILIKVLIYSIK